MEENDKANSVCEFCKVRPVETRRLSTVFGAASICQKCLPQYRQQLQRAIVQFHSEQKGQQDSETAA